MENSWVWLMALRYWWIGAGCRRAFLLAMDALLQFAVCLRIAVTV